MAETIAFGIHKKTVTAAVVLTLCSVGLYAIPINTFPSSNDASGHMTQIRQDYSGDVTDIGWLQDNSDLIVRGTVTAESGSQMERATLLSSRPMVYNTYELAVHQTFKGDTANHITIRVNGGTKYGRTIDIKPDLEFTPGEETILFLHKNESYYNVVARAHGKMLVQEDTVIREHHDGEQYWREKPLNWVLLKLGAWR